MNVLLVYADGLIFVQSTCVLDLIVVDDGPNP